MSAGKSFRTPTQRIAAVAPTLVRDGRAAALALVVLTPLAAVNGGYFPTSWGWTASALASFAAVAALARPTIRLAPLEQLALAAFVGLAAWTLASALWSPSAGAAVQEFLRTLVYVTGVAAALLVVRSGSYRALLAGIWASITATCLYGLGTRLFPVGLGSTQEFAGNRLAEPVGYWNGLGLLAAMGILLAFGLAAHGHGRIVRALASASAVPLSLSLYFTFSRGAWGALAVGLAILFFTDTRRVRLLLACAAAAPFAAVAVRVASQQNELIRPESLGALAAPEGRHVAGVAALSVAAAAAASLAVGTLRGRVSAAPNANRAAGIGLAALAAAAAVGVVVQFGSPASIAERGWRAFNKPPVRVTGTLNERLFTFSGSWRAELWGAAVDSWRDHKAVGAGGGTYEREWLERRSIPTKVENAHNLYAETLGELGPVGLALLLVALACPLAAGLRVRQRSLVPAATAAYVAFLIHAAIDWDWELPAVILPALLTGAALLVAARRDHKVVDLRGPARAAVVVLLLVAALAALGGVVGNRTLDRSRQATVEERFADATAEARRAARLAPWSAEPLQALGEAQLQQGKLAEARRSFRRAIAKDGGDWELWLDLAYASDGTARRTAALRALKLNPLSPEIASIRPALGLPPTRKSS